MPSEGEQLIQLNAKVDSLVQNMGYIHDGLKKDINYLKKSQQTLSQEMRDMKRLLDDRYVTQKEFSPVRNLVFGLVGTILMGVIGALMALVLK